MRDESVQWQLAGAGPNAYERYLVSAIFREMAGQLVEAAGELRPGHRVLDVACGTGIVARVATERAGNGGSVAGVDRNESMIAAARQIAPKIEWREADVESLPFTDGSFDAVFCQQALQFFSDPRAALAEMRRVLAPGRRLGFNVCCAIDRNAIYERLAELLSRYVGAEAGAMMRSPFSAWSREDLRGLVNAAGFREVRVILDFVKVRYPSASEFLRREAASSPLAGPIGLLEKEAREALVEELAVAVERFTDDDGVVFPLHSHTVVASTD